MNISYADVNQDLITQGVPLGQAPLRASSSSFVVVV